VTIKLLKEAEHLPVQAPLGLVRWQAEGTIDLRGTKGVAGVSAGFQSISLSAEVETLSTQEEVDQLAAAVTLLCSSYGSYAFLWLFLHSD
jgi:hypothetical protein